MPQTRFFLLLVKGLVDGEKFKRRCVEDFDYSSLTTGLLIPPPAPDLWKCDRSYWAGAGGGDMEKRPRKELTVVGADEELRLCFVSRILTIEEPGR